MSKVHLPLSVPSKIYIFVYKIPLRKHAKIYERTYRQRKSFKIKELKAYDEDKYGHLTMSDELSFDFHNTYGNKDYK